MKQKRNKASGKEQIESKRGTKNRNRGTQKGTRLARRNKLNLSTELKYRNRGTKK
jgi:hypothetical protein